MGYFVYINGRKYDRSILEAIAALLDGKIEKKISIDEAERINRYFLTKGVFSGTERRTYHHIINQFDFTTGTKNWLETQLLKIPESIAEKTEKIAEGEFGLFHLHLAIDPEVLEGQRSNPRNKVSFEEALRLGLHSFLTDASKATSPKGVLTENYPRLLGNNPNGADSLLNHVFRDHLRHAALSLCSGTEQPTTEPLKPLPTLEVSISENWVFSLKLHEFPLHHFWAVVDRAGDKLPYNYGVLNSA